MIIMINRIKNIYKNKTIFSNIIALFILKGSDYILPLILLPYLVRTLGFENFGLISFAIATISFFRAIVAYGFDLSATQQIAVNISDSHKVSEIFSSVLIIKFFLAICTFFFLVLMVIFIDKFSENWILYLVTFSIVIGDILFPVWYFQGIEKMKILTYLGLSYKIFFVLGVIIFLHDKEKYLLVPIIDAITYIIIGIVAMFIVLTKYNVSLMLPSYVRLKEQFFGGWHIFISQIAVTLYTSLNVFVLGILATNELVGIYSLAYKLYLALRGLVSPITQALFPYLSKEFKKDKIRYYKKVKVISIIYFSFLNIIAIFAYLYSAEIVKLITENMETRSIDVLKILLFALPFSIGSFYSVLLVIKSEGKTLSKITFISVVINSILVYPSISLYGVYGLAWQVVIVQFVQSTLQLRYNKEVWR